MLIRTLIPGKFSVNPICAIICIASFITWLFMKSRNSNLVKKLNYAAIYKSITDKTKQIKYIKKMHTINIIATVIMGIYIAGTIMLWALYVFLIVFTFGAILAGAATGSHTFFDDLYFLNSNILNLTCIYLTLIFTRLTLINNENYKILNDKEKIKEFTAKK